MSYEEPTPYGSTPGENTGLPVYLQLDPKGDVLRPTRAERVIAWAFGESVSFENPEHSDREDFHQFSGTQPNETYQNESTQLVFNSFEIRHYVKQPPQFQDMIGDESRTNTFQYFTSIGALNARQPDPDEVLTTMTEHEGLTALDDFLRTCADNRPKLTQGDVAQSMRETLTFIGEQEYQEAVDGLAAYWQTYLDVDPQNQLCLLPVFSELSEKPKSSDYLLANVLRVFPESERQHYASRIVGNLEQLTADSAHVRVVMMDDYMISGNQARATYSYYRQRPHFDQFANSFEVNLVVASASVLANGLEISPGSDDPSISVRAYFVAHDAFDSAGHSTHVTSIHASADYDYEDRIAELARELSDSTSEVVQMPPLTNIRRSYRPYHNIGTLEPLPQGEAKLPVTIDLLKQQLDSTLYGIHTLPLPDRLDTNKQGIVESRVQEIKDHYLLQNLSETQRAQAIQQITGVYEAATLYVAPAIAGFADKLLRDTTGRQLLFAGRDGANILVAARALQARFTYPIGVDQLHYVPLSRNLVYSALKNDHLKDYLLQEDIDPAKPTTLVDIGMFGSIVPILERVIPDLAVQYFISANINIPGYAHSAQNPSMRSMQTIAGNPAVHFLEDTFSGLEAPATNLIEDDAGRLIVEHAQERYGNVESLIRYYALVAIADYIHGLVEPPTQSPIQSLENLDAFLSDYTRYAKLMIPHQ